MSNNDNDNKLNRSENPSVDNGRGGSWPSYTPYQNKLGGITPEDSRTMRTGVGTGREFTGQRIMYSSSSSSFSSSSSSSSSSCSSSSSSSG